MEKNFVAQGQVTPKGVVRSGPKSNSSEILWRSPLPANLTKIRSKMKSLSFYFSHCKSMGTSGCHGQHSFDPICPKI